MNKAYQLGFTFIGILMVIAISGIGLAGIGIVWHQDTQRENEKELLFIGEQYHQAIVSYYESSPSGVKQYPKDPLAGNAFYWLGETFYVRRDYVKAADSFRQGFEALPSGPKAPDNLLKLSMSLNALKRDKEACVVLKQLVSKFGKTSAATKDKAQAEISRIGCQ